MNPAFRFFVITLIACTSLCKGQGADYREPFLGLYHTNSPPCINPIEQTSPNHYVRVEKDTASADSIIVIDSLYYGATGFKHRCYLDISDSTYFDGAQQGKFLSGQNLSIYIPDKICPPGHIYQLRKLWPVVSEPDINGITRSLYIFPQPATHSFTILLPGLNEKSELELLDINGKSVLRKDFSGSLDVDVSTLPPGIYMAHIHAVGFSLKKRVVLTN